MRQKILFKSVHSFTILTPLIPLHIYSDRTFDINITALESSFKTLQREVHPDFFTSASSVESDSAARASSALNIAYHTLRVSLTRAEYLLGDSAAGSEVGGGSSGSSSGGSENTAQRRGEGGGGEGAAPASPVLLAQVMDARELISDDDTPASELTALVNRTRVAITACESDLSKAFKVGDVVSARQITAALSFYVKIVQEADAAKEAREFAARREV